MADAQPRPSNWLSRQLASRPLVANSAASGLISVLAELLRHALTTGGSEPPDVTNVARQLAIGSAVISPLATFWHALVEILFRSWKAGSIFTVLAKTAAEQAIFAPVINAAFMTSQGLLEGRSPEEVQLELKAKFVEVMRGNVSFWVPVGLIQYKFVSPRFRVLFAQFMSVIWTVYLISKTSKAAELKPALAAVTAKVGAVRDVLAAPTPPAPAEQAPECVPEPASAATSKPEPEHAATPVEPLIGKSPEQPAAEPAEVATAAAEEPPAETSAEPSAEVPAGAAATLPAEPPTESPAESEAESPAEAPVQLPEEPAEELPAVQVIEAAASEPPAEAEAEPPAEAEEEAEEETAEPPAEAAEELSAEVPAEAAAEPAVPAAAHPQHQGEWVVDRTEGDWDAFLSENGVGWMKRKVFSQLEYGKGRIRMVVEQDGDSFSITNIAMKTTVMMFTIGGGKQENPTIEGTPHLMEPSWTEDGQVLLFRNCTLSGEELASRRQYLQGDELVVDLLSPKGVLARRIYRRV